MNRCMGVGIGFAALACGTVSAQYTAFHSGASTLQARDDRALVGQPVILSSGTPSLTIVGLDAGFTANTQALVAGQWRLRLRIWGGYDPAASPVFSNLLSEQVLTSSFSISAGSGTWGTLPTGGGWMLPNPVTVPSNGPVGITYVVEALSGGDWIATPNGRPWTIVSLPGGGPTSGSNAMPTGKGWYQRSLAQSVVNGNFNPADARSTTSSGYSGLTLRVYTRCTGDFTFDTTVDDSDFVIFAGAYSTLECADPAMPIGCEADYNNDGFVDDADFVVFATAYDALLCS